MKTINPLAIWMIISFSIFSIPSSSTSSLPTLSPDLSNVDCGLNEQMFGLSIIEDGDIHQFENCSEIIYPITEHRLNEYENNILLSNGYRYLLNEMDSTINQSFCLSSNESLSLSSSSYSMIRYNKSGHLYHKNMLLYFVTKYNKNSIKYMIHDFNYQNDKRFILKHKNPNIRYILVSMYNRQFVLHNDYHDQNDNSNGYQYQLINDPGIEDNYKHLGHEEKSLGFICIEMINKQLTIMLDDIPCDQWYLTNSFFEKIDFSFSYGNYIYFISKQMELVLFTEQELLSPKRVAEEFVLEKKSFKDFFVCKKSKPITKRQTIFNERRIMANIHGNQMGRNSKKIGKFSISTFIIVIIVNIIIAMILIFYFRTTSYFDDIID